MANLSESTLRMILYSAVATVTVAIGLNIAIKQSRIPPQTSRRVIPSPRTQLLPRLTASQKSSLGYPPDALPGARDVKTPYGYMRVYEWGPVEGRKVVMVHGDATPSPLYGPIADQLAKAGCRVLCLDLWGRGYSDTPSGVQHDCRLYAQQILFAIASSPIEWISGDSKHFSLIGFSMGATIVLDFFNSYAPLIESVVLLGPGGLIRTLPDVYTSFYFRHPSLISKNKMRTLLATTLDVETQIQPLKEAEKPEGFTPQGALQFQFDHHQGHIESFLSNIQYGPLQNQGEIWRKAGEIISGSATSEHEQAGKSPMYGGKILAICGQDDQVVVSAEVEENLRLYMRGNEHFVFKTVPGDHGFPWSAGTAVGKQIIEFWGLEAVKS